MNAILPLGPRIYGIAAVATAILALLWGAFVQPWQPLPDMLPAQTPVTYALAALFLVAGMALQWRRSARSAAVALALLNAAFVIGWAFRVAAMPAILGTWLGVAEQGAIVLGAVACFTLASEEADTRTVSIARVVRIAFGFCCLVFGAAHFVYVKETADMVPGWLPPTAVFWAYATGAGHVLAGLALVSGIRALLAARLLTAMFIGFGLLVWLPKLVAAPETQFAWGGNIVNLALTAAAWTIADSIARLSHRNARQVSGASMRAQPVP